MTPSGAERSNKLTSQSRFPILKIRNFRYYWGATIFSLVGEHIENVIRSWVIWELTGSVFWLSSLIFIHWIPHTLFSIPAGSIADRVNRQRVMLWAEVILTIAALGMFSMTYAGWLNEYWLAALLVLHAIPGPLANPCRQLFLHDMVGSDNLLAGVSLTSSLRHATQSVGKPTGQSGPASNRRRGSRTRIRKGSGCRSVLDGTSTVALWAVFHRYDEGSGGFLSPPRAGI